MLKLAGRPHIFFGAVEKRDQNRSAPPGPIFENAAFTVGAFLGCLRHLLTPLVFDVLD